MKSVADENPEQNSYVFKIGLDQEELLCEFDDIKTVLVDCGATTHVINDKSYFTNMDSNFDQSILSSLLMGVE